MSWIDNGFRVQQMVILAWLNNSTLPPNLTTELYALIAYLQSISCLTQLSQLTGAKGCWETRQISQKNITSMYTYNLSFPFPFLSTPYIQVNNYVHSNISPLIVILQCLRCTVHFIVSEYARLVQVLGQAQPTSECQLCSLLIYTSALCGK